jgi:hypothetical protein
VLALRRFVSIYASLMLITEAAQFTTASAPWWFVAALAGSLTIISTGSGAAISYLSTRASDKRKIDEERAARQDVALQKARDELRAGTAVMLVEAREFVRNYRDNFQRFPAGSGTGFEYRSVSHPAPLSIRPTYTAYWNLVLVGDEEVSEAAWELLNATRAFDLPLLQPGTPSPLSKERFQKMYNRHIVARRELIRIVKMKLAPVPLQPDLSVDLRDE